MAEKMPTLSGVNGEIELGEPTFVLRARDPLAPHMVALWVALRKGDTASALSIFSDTVSNPGHNYRAKPHDSRENVSSASAKAQEMNKWREKNSLAFFGLHMV
jgi:hypothetical protein